MKRKPPRTAKQGAENITITRKNVYKIKKKLKLTDLVHRHLI